MDQSARLIAPRHDRAIKGDQREDGPPLRVGDDDVQSGQSAGAYEQQNIYLKIVLSSMFYHEPLKTSSRKSKKLEIAVPHPLSSTYDWGGDGPPLRVGDDDVQGGQGAGTCEQQNKDLVRSERRTLAI